jgi:hypothetical protein
VVDGHRHVLHRPQRFEAAALCRHRQRGGVIGPGATIAVGKHDAELDLLRVISSQDMPLCRSQRRIRVIRWRDADRVLERSFCAFGF